MQNFRPNTIITDVLSFHTQMQELSIQRKEKVNALSVNSPVDEIKACSIFLNETLETGLQIMNTFLNQYLQSEPFQANTMVLIKREHNQYQKEVLKTFLLKLRQEQENNQLWDAGTPREVIGLLRLTQAEEEYFKSQFSDFYDGGIQADYIRYAVRLKNIPGMGKLAYLDIDTLLDMIKNTKDAPSSVDQQIMEALVCPNIPDTAVSLRDPFGADRTTLTVENFEAIEPDDIKKFYKAVELVKQHRIEHTAIYHP